MTDSRSNEQHVELRRRARVQLEEVQKILDELDLKLIAARLDYVISELKEIESS